MEPQGPGTVTTVPRRLSKAWVLVFALAIAAACAVALLIVGDEDVRVVRGDVENVNVDGTAIAIDGEGYVIGTGLSWKGLDGTWRHRGQPDCMPPLSRGATIELGIMSVPATDDAPGLPNHVVWVRCVSGPTHVEEAPAGLGSG